MERKHIRYTIDVDGRPRKILSVSLQRTGLIFDLKPAKWYRPISGTITTDGPIQLSKASFHHSRESPTGNLITNTTTTARGVLKYRQFTLALKTNDRFAQVFARRFPDLSNGWPESDRGIYDISLGKFDPRLFNLIICVFVGNPHRMLKLTDPILEYGINVCDCLIGDYKVLVLYSFYKQPSIDHGTSSFMWTTRDEDAPPDGPLVNEYIINGFDDYHVREEFFRAEHKFKINYLELTDKWLGDRVVSGY